MDTQRKDILEQLLERLDKMDSQQHKLDRVIERLDTLQNVLEKQNKKQNQLDEKLVEMTIKLEQEKIVTTEQLRAAHQETTETLSVIDSPGESTIFQHYITQQQQGWGSQIADKLKSIDDRTADTARKYDQLTSWSRKTEDKLTELADNNNDIIKTFLVETRSVKDLVKGQTNSELIWLIKQIDKKFSDIGSVVRDIFQQQREAKEETVRSTGQMVRTVIQHDKQHELTESLNDKQKLSTGICDKHIQAILDLERKIVQLNSSVLDVPNEIKTSLDTMLTTNKRFIIDLENTLRNLIVEMNVNSKDESPSGNTIVKSDVNKLLETFQSELQKQTAMVITESEKQTGKLINATDTAKNDLGHLIQTQENMQTLINSLVDRIQGNTTTVVKRINTTEALITSWKNIIMHNMEKSTTGLKDYIHTTKREIFAVTEKEAQIVRERIQGPLLSQGKYTFDFYVNDFQTLVRSGKSVRSLPWHINEMQTCVIGCVNMLTVGEMEVWLMGGRHPREVGLQAMPGKTLKTKATICDIYKKQLPPLGVGEVTAFFNEADTNSNVDMGYKVGVMSYDTLLNRGYGNKEEYGGGAILIRYEVTVKLGRRR